MMCKMKTLPLVFLDVIEPFVFWVQTVVVDLVLYCSLLFLISRFSLSNFLLYTSHFILLASCFMLLTSCFFLSYKYSTLFCFLLFCNSNFELAFYSSKHNTDSRTGLPSMVLAAPESLAFIQLFMYCHLFICYLTYFIGFN